SPSNSGVGIDVIADGTSSSVVEVRDNDVSGFSIALRGGARDPGIASLDLTLVENTLAAGGSFEFTAVYLSSGNGSPGEDNRLCVNLSDNQATVTQPFNLDYLLEQWMGNAFQLEGFVGDGTDEAAVEAFVSSRDVGGANV